MLTILAPEEFPYILMGLAANFALCTFQPFLSFRPKAFSAEYMKNFDAEHEAAFPGQKLIIGGAPDHGSGWYSKKLSYADWFKLGIGQRVHQNNLEGMPLLFLWTFPVSFYIPMVGLIGVWGYLVARILYTIAYKINPGTRAGPGFLMLLL